MYTEACRLLFAVLLCAMPGAAWTQSSARERIEDPDVLRGLRVGEEAQDIPELDMGNAERVPMPPAATQQPETPRAAALPAYPDERFSENLPTWQGLVAEGRKSGADLAAMLSTKAVLSEAQRKQLLDLDNPPVADPEPALTQDQSDFVGQMEGHEQ